MAATTTNNPESAGYNPATKTFHSLRPPIHLPQEDAPISVVDYVLSIRSLSRWPNSTTALIDSATGRRIPYSDLIRRQKSLSYYLQDVLKLSRHDVALVICPNCVQVPILYLSLLSIGVVVSPGNPVSTGSEIARLVELSGPTIAFATSSTAHKLPKLRLGTILVDSPEFESMMTHTFDLDLNPGLGPTQPSQSDVAAILYSSGTTGRIKGVMLTHRNLIGVVALCRSSAVAAGERASPPVLLYTVPLFHVFGFIYSLKSVALMETVVMMPRFGLDGMLKAVGEFGVTDVAMAPPVVVAMVKSGSAERYDLSSLKSLVVGAAPLGKDVIAAFKAKFPAVELAQGYGLTELTGPVSRVLGPKESKKWGSVGRLYGLLEARIVDPETQEALPPGKQGELWVKGPTTFKGKDRNTPRVLVINGWLRTGDLCYFDDQGFLYVVDRLKELIKYNGYQVAPAELEQLLQSHPGVADAAVIPYPDEEAGQLPFACVLRRPGCILDERSVMEFVAKQVAPYKKIRRVAFVNSIPKSPAGKILRKDLRKMVLAPLLTTSSSKL
ncbi:unnamed protein product [Linum tenue]|uniref:4-coumarate--CoA ligase n=1 Tax=Linum tenue TaxID=586396 RepID=A0AAV0NG42_9ROSI|nr:unnamed protein product [Linum tenue]